MCEFEPIKSEKRMVVMKKNVFFGIILSVVLVAVLVTLVFAYVGKGNSLSTAVNGGSCTGDPATCSGESSMSCSGGSSSCSGGSSSCGSTIASPYYDPKVDYSAIEKQAVEMYSKETGDTNIKAKAFGIGKVNVVLYKDNKIVARYTFENGKFVK
jgi:hypothetical protein